MNFDVQLLRIHNISWEYNFLNINVDSSLSLTLKKYQIKAKLLFILNQVSFYHFSANDKWIERRFRNLLRNWNFNLLLRKMDNFSRHNDNVVKFIDARKYHQRSTSSIDITSHLINSLISQQQKHIKYPLIVLIIGYFTSADAGECRKSS